MVGVGGGRARALDPGGETLGPGPERLVAAVDSLAAGHAAAVLVSGEAGIGKTHLVRRALSRASGRGCRVLYAPAQDYDHGIAYATLKDLFAGLLTGADPGHVAGGLDAAARRELAALLDAADQVVLRGRNDVEAPSRARPSRPAGSDDSPAATERVPMAGDGANAAPAGSDRPVAQSPYVLTTRLLRELARSSPVVLAVDDAHLADDESLTALCLAARHLATLPIMLVFAARRDKGGPGSGFAATVGRLVDGTLGVDVELRPLDRDDLAALLSGVLDGRPDEALVTHIHQQSGGNPLFARETLRSLQASGTVRVEDGTYYLVGDRVPGALSRRGALLHRVFQQDQHSRELARVVSAFGRVHLDHVRLLAELTDLHPESVQTAFDSLTEAGILRSLAPDRPGWYEFGHPLMAEVLYEDLGPVERRRIHRAIAADAERADGGAAGMGSLERATHVVEAASPGDRDAVDVVLRAAAATRGAAPLSAARWYQRALDLLGPDADTDAGPILARQAVAYWKGSRPESSLAAGQRALELLPPGDQHAMTLATVVNATYAMGRLEAALDRLTRGLPDVERPAAFLAQRVLLLAQLGRADEAVDQLAEARAAAAGSAPADQVIAFSHLGHAENCVGDYVGLLAAVDRLRELGSDAGRLPLGTRLSALESAAYLMSTAGGLRAARELRDEAVELASEAGYQDIGGQIVNATANIQFMAGDWTAAQETVQSGMVRLEFSGLANNLSWLRLKAVQILVERGRLADAEGLLDAGQTPPELAVYQAVEACVRARIALARQDYATALPILRAQRALARRNSWREVASAALVPLASGSLEVGDEATARAATEELSALATRTGKPSLRRSADLAAAAVYRQPALAAAVLDDARAQGLTFVAARAQYLLGALGQDPADNLRQALTAFAELQTPVWEKRVLARAHELGVAVDRAVSTSRQRAGELTETERQLVRLVHDGLSNREISQVLHYSRKTIEAYLSRLYRKLGCRTRVELVVALERGGLLDTVTGRP